MDPAPWSLSISLFWYQNKPVTIPFLPKQMKQKGCNDGLSM